MLPPIDYSDEKTDDGKNALSKYFAFNDLLHV